MLDFLLGVLFWLFIVYGLPRIIGKWQETRKRLKDQLPINRSLLELLKRHPVQTELGFSEGQVLALEGWQAWVHPVRSLNTAVSFARTMLRAFHHERNTLSADELKIFEEIIAAEERAFLSPQDISAASGRHSCGTCGGRYERYIGARVIDHGFGPLYRIYSYFCGCCIAFRSNEPVSEPVNVGFPPLPETTHPPHVHAHHPPDLPH